MRSARACAGARATLSSCRRSRSRRDSRWRNPGRPPPGVPGLVLPRGKQYAKGAGHLRIIELSVMRIMRVTNRTLWPLAVGELAPGDYYSAAERRLLASHTNPSASSRRRRSGSDTPPLTTRSGLSSASVSALCPRKDPLGLRRRCSLYRHECIAEFIPALLSPWGGIPPSPPDHLCLSQEADFCGAHDDIRGTARKHRRWLAKCLLD